MMQDRYWIEEAVRIGRLSEDLQQKEFARIRPIEAANIRNVIRSIENGRIRICDTCHRELTEAEKAGLQVM